MSIKRKLSLGLMTSILLIAMNLTVANAATSATVTVSAVVDPTIAITASTGTVSFGNVDPSTKPQTNLDSPVTLTVNSNSQYHITAYANDDLKAGSDIIPIANLKVKEHSSGSWIDMTKVAGTPVEVIAPIAATASRGHAIDFQLNINWAIKPGSYTCNVIFAASQV